MEKREIRASVARERKNRTPEELKKKSELIMARILALPEYTKAKTVYVYLDSPGEVETETLIEDAWQQKKRLAAPRVMNDEEMAFFYITSYEELEAGSFGIREPKRECLPAEEESALVIVPGVAYDLTRSRCGHGKGYYDRYLGSHSRYFSIAPAFEFQIFDQIPAFDFDIRPQVLVTESRIIK